VALRDALLAIKKPFIEVHISNIFASRTLLRQHSYFSDICDWNHHRSRRTNYLLALRYAHDFLKNCYKTGALKTMAMDMRKIRKLIELINETGIAEN